MSDAPRSLAPLTRWAAVDIVEQHERVWIHAADVEAALDQATEDSRMGHVRLDECSDAVETQGQPLYNRISAKIQKLSDAKSEIEHILKASVATMDALRAEKNAAEHRQQAAEYRAQRIVLDAELKAENADLRAAIAAARLQKEKV